MYLGGSWDVSGMGSPRRTGPDLIGYVGQANLVIGKFAVFFEEEGAHAAKPKGMR